MISTHNISLKKYLESLQEKSLLLILEGEQDYILPVKNRNLILTREKVVPDLVLGEDFLNRVAFGIEIFKYEALVIYPAFFYSSTAGSKEANSSKNREEMIKQGKQLVSQVKQYLESYSPQFVFCLPEVTAVFEDPSGRLVELKELTLDFGLN